ncbi:hypothetical protein [Acanthopleuribacter pedis]|uniref:Uncharacterized protein n=1 Tax=Acanthopleuribacter pedis TaxID=442870 RepID=A0A8J7U5R3_9BACT|nr:hypothetical protein [Acanthopleuribacter pedis]MBO1319581.1 hypothetical protein [Acanthopleuribacter pedis]
MTPHFFAYPQIHAARFEVTPKKGTEKIAAIQAKIITANGLAPNCGNPKVNREKPGLRRPTQNS